jgi:Uma2 family endonuclease
MSLTLPRPATPEGPSPRRWTVAEYQKAAKVGLFGPEERLELIDGEIYKRMPPEPPHSNGIDFVRAALVAAFRSVDCYLRTENPISIPGDSQPQPDAAVVVGNPPRYRGRFPIAEEIYLLVEVADSSLNFDRRRKGPQYAAAGIREYWILNLRDRCLEVFRAPQNGAWTVTFTVPENGALSSLTAPEASVAVADLLP